MKKKAGCNEELLRYWHAHIDAWRKSGQSAQGYARRNGLYKNSIRYWRRKLSSHVIPESVVGDLPAVSPKKASPILPAGLANEVKFVPVALAAKSLSKLQKQLVLRVGGRFRIDCLISFPRRRLLD